MFGYATVFFSFFLLCVLHNQGDLKHAHAFDLICIQQVDCELHAWFKYSLMLWPCDAALSFHNTMKTIAAPLLFSAIASATLLARQDFAIPGQWAFMSDVCSTDSASLCEPLLGQ